jgi:hypothetical protein
MTASESTPTPKWTPNTVFFVGNGVMRVAPLTGGADPAERVDLPPSWAEYMLDLWKSIDKNSPDYIDLDEFSPQPCPLQCYTELCCSAAMSRRHRILVRRWCWQAN